MSEEKEIAGDKEKERIVNAVIEELQLKGGSKKRLLEKLVDKYGYDEAKVKYKAKRAFITERYERGEGGGGAEIKLQMM